MINMCINCDNSFKTFTTSAFSRLNMVPEDLNFPIDLKSCVSIIPEMVAYVDPNKNLGFNR